MTNWRKNENFEFIYQAKIVSKADRKMSTFRGCVKEGLLGYDSSRLALLLLRLSLS